MTTTPDDGTLEVGPPWTITNAGYTPRGWPWVVVRKRGGQMIRLTVHGAQATPQGILEAIETTVAAWPPRPGPDVF